MEIEKKLYSEIKEYCKLNQLKIGDFINDLLKKAFNIEKFGEAPPFFITPTVTIEEIFGDDVKSVHWMDTEVKEIEQFCDHIKNRCKKGSEVDTKPFFAPYEVVTNNSQVDIPTKRANKVVDNKYYVDEPHNPKVYDKPAEIKENAVWDDSEKFEKKPVKRKLK